MSLKDKVKGMFDGILEEELPVKGIDMSNMMVNKHEIKCFELQIEGKELPIQIAISGNTISINTTLDIILNCGMLGIKGAKGIHLNPDDLNPDTLKMNFELEQKTFDQLKLLKPPRETFRDKMEMNKLKRDLKFRRK